MAVMSASEVKTVAEALSTTIEKALTKEEQVKLSDFCSLWSTIKPVLEKLQPIAALIPVVGVIISGAIATLLTVGNAAAIALRCPT